ncbi:phytoene desaturase family protein [Brevibacterium atlanticum]|uniref:phytoene desaturase family protein n=1 Tax=Brevibacterium atlanticum TaxID=2697563 RepID=UPI001421B59D|nr:NAD(P)/FAD-dependent oxidoreductase [Brevibacterium atlanticum]
MSTPLSSRNSDADVVIIGSGINSLVAAAKLSGAGRKVVLLESRSTIGGFIASGERTLPGFVHDTFSSWHPLFVSGPGYAEFGDDLHEHGLEYANTDRAMAATVGTVRGEQRCVIAHRSRAETAESLTNSEDGRAYLDMLDEFDRQSPTVFGMLGTEVSQWSALARTGFTALRTLGPKGSLGLVRSGASSARALFESTFVGTDVDALWTPWLLHSGLGPDSATGGIMVPVFAASLHGFGMPVVRGGAANFIAAFTSLLRGRDVEILTDTTATGIETSHGSVRAVRTDGGRITTGIVIASTSPQALYQNLLADADGVSQQTTDSRRFRSGKGAAQIHFALSSPVPWSDSSLADIPLVHLSEGSSGTAISIAEAAAGLVPRRPTVVVGQQCVLDPSRAPSGHATLWVQLQEVPYRPEGDAAGEIEGPLEWSESSFRRAFVDRIIDRIEEYAPGFRQTILADDLISPTDLEAHNPNAVNGDPYGGSAELDQNLMFRPFLSGAAHATAVRGVWHIGAATHPGPGLGGGSGFLAAQQILSPGRLARMRSRFTSR